MVTDKTAWRIIWMGGTAVVALQIVLLLVWTLAGWSCWWSLAGSGLCLLFCIGVIFDGLRRFRTSPRCVSGK